MSLGLEPIIKMLTDIVTAIVLMVVIYAGVLLVLKQRITDKRRFYLYKQLGSLGLLLLFGIYVWYRAGHV